MRSNVRFFAVAAVLGAFAPSTVLASSPTFHVTLAPACLIVQPNQPSITYTVYNQGTEAQTIAVSPADAELSLANPADTSFVLLPSDHRDVSVLIRWTATMHDTRIYFVAQAPQGGNFRVNRGLGALVVFDNYVCKSTGPKPATPPFDAFPWIVGATALVGLALIVGVLRRHISISVR